MKIVAFGHDHATVELDPADCFLLAEACRAAVADDDATNLSLTETLGAALTAAGMAAATHAAISGLQGRPVAKVVAIWMPRDDRAAH